MSKLFVLEPLGLALSEKQIPQIVETIRSVENSKKLWRPSRCVSRCATRWALRADEFAEENAPQRKWTILTLPINTLVVANRGREAP